MFGIGLGIIVLGLNFSLDQTFGIGHEARISVSSPVSVSRLRSGSRRSGSVWHHWLREISANILVASTQFERPFDYSTSSWVRDNDCRAKNVSKLAQYVALKSATSRGGIQAENVSKLAQYVALKSISFGGGIRAKNVSKLAQYVALKSATSVGGNPGQEREQTGPVCRPQKYLFQWWNPGQGREQTARRAAALRRRGRRRERSRGQRGY